MTQSLIFDKEELVFHCTSHKNRFFSKVTLKNTSKQYIGYQMKGSNVKRYTISKPLGKMKPLSTEQIQVEMALNDIELGQLPNISDKFCCFYTYIDEEDADRSEKELEQILKKKQNNKTIYRLKIKSRVEQSKPLTVNSEEHEYIDFSNANTFGSSNMLIKESSTDPGYNAEMKSSVQTENLDTFKNSVDEIIVETNIIHSGNIQDSIDMNIEEELKQVMNKDNTLPPKPLSNQKLIKKSLAIENTSNKDFQTIPMKPLKSEIIQVTSQHPSITSSNHMEL
jgi:hypothetical protein